MSDDNKDLKDKVQDRTEEVKHSSIGDAVEGAKNTVGSAVNATKSKFEEAQERVSEGTDKVTSTTVGDMADGVKDAAGTVKDSVTDAAGAAKDKVTEIKDSMTKDE
jgi:phage-related protein